MTIDEAIAHAREVAEANDGCTKCAEEHKQLAEWLEELKDLRKWKEQEEKACDRFYEQGRADKYQEITSEYMLLTEKQVEEIRADAINAIKNDLHKRLTEEMNNPYQNQDLCQGLYFGIQRCDWYLDDSKEQE